MSDKKTFRIIFFTLIGAIILMVAAGIAGFFFVMRGNEITTVPDVTGFNLENALLSVQEKGLNSKIQLKYSSTLGDRGTILAQDPNPGAILRAGKHVTLSVSRGTVIDKIENYIGWDLKDLNSHLKSISATYGIQLAVKDPVIYQYNEAPEGTILQQKPEPGENLTQGTELELVVSRGSGNSIYEVPDYVGMDFQSALSKVAAMNVPFTFVSKFANKNEQMGVIISQNPIPESKVSGNSIIQLTMTNPKHEENMVFGILERTIPDYPVKIVLKFEVVSNFGDRTVIFTTKHKGGVISIPYYVEAGSTLVLSADGKELVNFPVKK